MLMTLLSLETIQTVFSDSKLIFSKTFRQPPTDDTADAFKLVPPPIVDDVEPMSPLDGDTAEDNEA